MLVVLGRSISSSPTAFSYAALSSGLRAYHWQVGNFAGHGDRGKAHRGHAMIEQMTRT